MSYKNSCKTEKHKSNNCTSKKIHGLSQFIEKVGCDPIIDSKPVNSNKLKFKCRKIPELSGKIFKFRYKKNSQKIKINELINNGSNKDINYTSSQIPYVYQNKRIDSKNHITTKKKLKKYNNIPYSKQNINMDMNTSVTTSNLYHINNNNIEIDDDVLKTTLLKHGNGSKTINGHTLKLLKSAMQKYIRRGNDKAITVFGELNLFSALCHPDNINFKKYLGLHPDLKESGIIKNGKGTITNTINRLRAIVSEDISIAGPGIPSIADELIEKYYIDITNPYPIIKLVKILMESKKIRLLSDLKTVYNLPPYYGKTEDENKRIVKYTKCLNDIYDNKVADMANGSISDNIKYYYKRKDLKVFYWVSKLIDKDGTDQLYKN